MSMRERALSQKTLVCMLQALEGKTTTVEFRDETTVTGRIDHVDGYMNIDMTDVNYVAPSGTSTTFSKFGCQGKFIRYVLVPEEMDVMDSIKDRLEMLSRMPMGGRGRGGGRGFRGGRGGRGFRGGGRRGGGGGGYRGGRGGSGGGGGGGRYRR